MSSPAPRHDESPTSPWSSRPPPSSFPFPRYDLTQRQASRSYPSRRSSAASSIGGVLESTAHSLGSSVEESGNNAISTLLQPPIVRTGLLPHASGPSAPKPPSTKDIPPVTLPSIPHIENSVFRPYLNQAGALYDIFRNAREETEDGVPASSRRGSRVDATIAEGLPLGMQRRLSGSALPVSPGEGSPQARRRNSGGVARRSALTVAPLSTIPTVYFDQDFHLENPRTFDVVSEKAEIARPPSGANGAAVPTNSIGKKALAANAILQEKLSWYMDTVEIHLISSISTASTSFFAALGSLRELHGEATDSVAKIKALREDLTDLDNGMAVGGLKIVSKRRRRDNMRRLGAAVQQLELVMESVGRCEEDIDRGEVDKALGGLADVERLIAGEPERFLEKESSPTFKGNLVDLRGVKALEGAGNDIAFLRKRIGKAYESKFMETLLGDLRRHVDEVPSTATFQRWDNASSRLRGQHVRRPSAFPAYLHVEDEFRSELRSQLKGLARSDSIMSAAVSYREAILREFKNLIRRHLPSSNDDDAESTTSIMTQESRTRSSQEKSSILARNLRSLEADGAEEMFKNIYSNVGEALRRLGTQVKVLLDITSSLGNPHPVLKSPPRSPALGSLGVGSIEQLMRGQESPGPPPALLRQEEIQQALDLSNLLGQAVDIAQSQITKVLKVRVEQTTHLELPHFLRYFTINRLFADECEAVSGRGGSALKTVVHDHIKSFVNLSAEAERQRLVQRMDADKWDAKDFTEEDSLRLSRIMEASTKDVESWSKVASIWDEESDGTPNAVTTNGDTNGASGTDKVRSAMIDEQKYILPTSALSVATGMEAFEQLLTGIPSMGTDITAYLIEYLKLFNSRAWQLILGAGATRSAGLKNITTRHLALSSQSLSFVITLVPYVREFARRHLPASSALISEFDKVKRIFQEHQSDIHDKLVEIMTGRAVSHVNAMKKIDWDTASDKDSANPYMETLVKETATLYKVLARYLPDTAVQLIMGPVIADYREQWAKAFGGVAVKTQVGKNRLLRDAEHFKSRISKLEGAGDIGDFILRIAEEKAIQVPDMKKEAAPVAAPEAADETPDAAPKEEPKGAPETDKSVKESDDTEAK